MSSRILVVEDDEGMRMSLCDRLRSQGYHVTSEGDGQAGFERATNEVFDLIVLDVRLPNRDGFDICRSLRRNAVQTPVLMLTARGQVDDRVLGLKLGADDYLVKPFEPIELLARIEALLRRPPALKVEFSPDSYAFGEVLVDLVRDEVLLGENQVAMQPMEYRLLRYFVKNKNVVLSRDRILNDVWGYEFVPTTRTVDVHVAGIRQKIEPDPRRPRFLLTLHGRGYKFVGSLAN